MKVTISYTVVTTDCPIEGQVYQECASCVATCSRPFPICPSRKCTSGCACPAGQVVDTVNKRCVSILRCSQNCAVSFKYIYVCIYFVPVLNY